MSKKLFVKGKKKYLLDKRIGIGLGVIYAICLLCIRFLDCIEKYIANRVLFCTVAMVVVIIVMCLNYTMCKDSVPNKKLMNKISDFDMKTNNKRDIIGQRNTLISYFNVQAMKTKAITIFGFFEGVICIVVFIMYICNMNVANRVTGIIIDIQTIVMAFCFYMTNHYRFVICKNLT